jgi:hypothetical protein
MKRFCAERIEGTRRVLLVMVFAAAIALVGCTGTGTTTKVVSPVSGVVVSTQSAAGSTADGSLSLAPASAADRRIVSPATIIASCRVKFGCPVQLPPTEITLARVSEVTDNLRDRLAWVVRWDVPTADCPPDTGPPNEPHYAPTSCRWWMVVDAKSGTRFGSWAVG